MRKSVGVVFSCLLIVATCQSWAASQEAQVPPADLAQLGKVASYVGHPIEEINLPGVDPEEAARLVAATPLKIGEPLGRQGVHDAIQALFASGVFSDIQVDAEHTLSDGVKLTFLTVPNYFVGQITVTGVSVNPSASQLAAATRLQLGELYTKEKLDRALAGMQRILEENGYHRSAITHTEEPDPHQRQMNLTLGVKTGPRAMIGEITVEGDAGYSKGQIEDIARFHPGVQVAATRLTKALQRLRKTYQKQNRLLAQVSATAQKYRPETDSVDYIFKIARGPVVEISAEGFNIRQGKLKQLVPIYEEGALDDDLLNEGRRNIQNHLQTLGYFDATVGVSQKTQDDGKSLRVLYVVNPGARHKLAAIRVAGNELFDDDQIRAVLQEQTAGRLFSHGRFSEALMTQDVRNIQDLYRANGYRQVEVTSKRVENFEDDPRKLAIDFGVNEGPQTRVAWVRFDGNFNIPTEQLLESAHIQTAEGQGFNEAILAEDQENTLGAYFNNGFTNANVDVTYVPMESAVGELPKVGVVFTVHEGEQFFVSNVFLTGLHHTRPGVAQRELLVHPRNPLSQQEMLETQRQLYNLGLFNQVDTAIQNPEGSNPRKNVLINVEEAQRYTFDYGFGFEFQTGQPSVGTNQPLGKTGASPRVSFGLTRINLGGRHQTVTMKANLSQLQQRGLIGFEAPRLNYRDLRFTATALYDNTVDVSTFTSQRTEGTIKLEQVLSRKPLDGSVVSSLTYAFSYRRVQASNIEVTENLIPLLSKPTRVGEPNLVYLRNRRDNDLESTKGNYTTIEAGAAAAYFGSEADFSRLLARNTTYHAFARNPRTQQAFVLARSTSIGVEIPFGNTVLIGPADAVPPGHTLIPLPERFYSGGGNSHRGFGLNQAGPRDPFTGFPLGGSGLFLNNLELRFPNIALPYLLDNIGFTVFHDMGNVFDTPLHMFQSLGRWHQSSPQLCLQESTHTQCTYNYLSHAVGIGVRYQTPIGPLRFDFGYNLNPPAFPSYTNVTTNTVNGVSTGQFGAQHAGHFNFSFSIGQSF